MSHAQGHGYGNGHGLPLPSILVVSVLSQSLFKHKGCLTPQRQHGVGIDTLPEWSKGVDSSSTSASCVGSNPTGVILNFNCWQWWVLYSLW